MSTYHGSARRDGSRYSSREEPFSIHGVSILLLLGLLGLCAYIVYYRLNINIPGAVSTMSPSKVITTYVTIALVVAGVAGGIGALVYLVSKRSVAAANLAISLVLLLAIGVLGYSLYNNMQAVEAMRKRATGGGNAPGAAPATPRPMTPTPPPARLTPPAPPAMPRPQPGPTITPTIPAPTPRRATTVPNPAPQPAEPKAQDPAVTKVVEALDAEIVKQIEALATSAEKTIPALTKRPTRERVELENRVRNADALDRDGKALADRIRGASQELRTRLAAAGVGDADMNTAVATYASSNNRFSLITAISRVGFIVDAGRDEAKLLLDNYNSWRIAGGQIESKDFGLQGRLRGARSRVESIGGDADALIGELRGK
jgi:hypothetical protein